MRSRVWVGRDGRRGSRAHRSNFSSQCPVRKRGHPTYTPSSATVRNLSDEKNRRISTGISDPDFSTQRRCRAARSYSREVWISGFGAVFAETLPFQPGSGIGDRDRGSARTHPSVAALRSSARERAGGATAPRGRVRASLRASYAVACSDPIGAVSRACGVEIGPPVTTLLLNDSLGGFQKSRKYLKSLILLARPERFERPTPKFVAWCSIQLSYGRAGRVLSGRGPGPSRKVGRTRNSNRWTRRTTTRRSSTAGA